MSAAAPDSNGTAIPEPEPDPGPRRGSVDTRSTAGAGQGRRLSTVNADIKNRYVVCQASDCGNCDLTYTFPPLQ